MRSSFPDHSLRTTGSCGPFIVFRSRLSSCDWLTRARDSNFIRRSSISASYPDIASYRHEPSGSLYYPEMLHQLLSVASPRDGSVSWRRLEMITLVPAISTMRLARETLFRPSDRSARGHHQGCRGYGYPWIYPCVDIRHRLPYGYIHGYFTYLNLNCHITSFELKLIPLVIRAANFDYFRKPLIDANNRF